MGPVEEGDHWVQGTYSAGINWRVCLLFSDFSGKDKMNKKKQRNSGIWFIQIGYSFIYSFIYLFISRQGFCIAPAVLELAL